MGESLGKLHCQFFSLIYASLGEEKLLRSFSSGLKDLLNDLSSLLVVETMRNDVCERFVRTVNGGLRCNLELKRKQENVSELLFGFNTSQCSTFFASFLLSILFAYAEKV
ncbi:hypothetical protein BT69DRAFT_489668 [Atractiella rhizophila]|nr:hypothetical protein BT69DRAFT_489668 [Atractiella rhizophila]